jgi:dUTP pyrophosphatase
VENSIQVKIKRIINSSRKSKIPLYATRGAAGADLFACLDQDLIVKPGERVQISTGLAIELPSPNLVALIFARSGLASKKGLALSNGVGVIDADYRGEIMVPMVNNGKEDVLIQSGDRIAQMLFLNNYKASFIEVEELEDSLRGEGGFGSTGQK